jgi:acetyl esterase/lipase
VVDDRRQLRGRPGPVALLRAAGTRASIVRVVLVVPLLVGCAAASPPAGPSPNSNSPTVTATATRETASERGAGAVVVTQEAYGPDPQQAVTVSRRPGSSGRTVIFLHGGGWRQGRRTALAQEAADWARHGWVAVNADYRLGKVDGHPGDGRLMLADVAAVLAKYRAQPYVDPARIVVYGESAGGHLATWLGAVHGDEIVATVAFSPVSSIAGAIIAGEQPGAGRNVRTLGAAAEEFFGYSVETTDAHRYLARVRAMFIAVSTDEWVDPDIHGRALCTALGRRCRLVEFPGVAHAAHLLIHHPGLALEARLWAEART